MASWLGIGVPCLTTALCILALTILFIVNRSTWRGSHSAKQSALDEQEEADMLHPWDNLDESADDNGVMAFVNEQREKAASAYIELYGDGFGIGDEAPPPLETFIENYMVEALHRETQRILRLKGYAVPELPRDEGSLTAASLSEVRKKDAPVTLDGMVEGMLVQKKQKQEVDKRVRVGKPREVLAPAEPEQGDQGSDSVAARGSTSESSTTTRPPASSMTTAAWLVECGDPLYQRHTYQLVEGCSPGPSPGVPCRRLIVDNFVTAAEQLQMREVMDRGLEGLFHQGAETLLVPDPFTKRRLGPEGFRLTAEILARVRAYMPLALNLSADIFYSGSFFKRMDHPPLDNDMQLNRSHSSSTPHVDKANIASYDWSALLYFNTVDEDFGGGELMFNDVDMDRVLQPRGGQLIIFSSGLENLHQVLPMQWGSRYVLAMWFTCSSAHQHTNLTAGLTSADSHQEMLAHGGEL